MGQFQIRHSGFGGLRIAAAEINPFSRRVIINGSQNRRGIGRSLASQCSLDDQTCIRRIISVEFQHGVAFDDSIAIQLNGGADVVGDAALENITLPPAHDGD